MVVDNYITNCLYWAVANLPVVCLYKPGSYIITEQGYRYEDGIKFKCLIHAAIKLSSDYYNNYYFDFEGMYGTSCIETWTRDWVKERHKENCKRWDHSTYIYLLKDIKTKAFWKRMESLGSPYNEEILQQERLNIFQNCYGSL